MASTCRSVPVTLEYARYDGTSPSGVQELIADCPGVAASFGDDGRLVVREEGEEDRVVQRDWVVTRTPDDLVTVHSGRMFARFFEDA